MGLGRRGSAETSRGGDRREVVWSHGAEDTLWLVFPAFVPHPALRNPHLMTVASYLLPRRWLGSGSPAGVERQFEVAADNKVVARCHWQAEPTEVPTLLLLHGLSGSHSSSYMVGLAGKAMQYGLNVLRLNMRNCGDTEHLATTLYHSGLSSDVEVVIDTLADEGHRRIYLAGFSMGGNIALRVAGLSQAAGRSILRGVAAVSPAIDLALAVQNIDQGFVNGLYRRSFMAHLRGMLRRKASQFPGRFDLTGLRRVRTLQEFDDRFTAPSFGFGDAANYYRTATALPLLEHIKVPTLFVQAADDPMLPASQIDQVSGLDNPAIELLVPRTGGHCAFLSRRPAVSSVGRDLDRYWAENRVVQFLLGLAP